MYSNKIDDLIDSFKEEDFISRRQTRNTTSSQVSDTKKNRVAGHSEMEEEATGRNRIAGQSEKGKRREGVYRNISEISFLDQEITKYNSQKDEISNPQLYQKRLLLARKIPRFTSSSNQNPT